MTSPDLIERFKEKAAAAGYHVSVAESHVRAVDHIIGLVKDHGVKTAVISDSPIAD